MRRTLTMLMMCAVLSMPVVAIGDDQTIPPEAHWTPTPAARSTVDLNRLATLLVDKGMITPREYTQLTQPQASLPAQQGRARVWTWEEIDHNPVRSTGGD